MAVSFFKTVRSYVNFLFNWKNSGGNLVDQNTANLRAAICEVCHNNKPTAEVRKVGCSMCGKMGAMVVDKTRSSIVGNNRTPLDGKIMACAICGCDLKISVWIPNSVLLSKEDANAYPTNCWKKAILENRDL